MISFQMEDVKAFMNKLLLSQTFDAFHVVEGSIITYSTFHFDGICIRTIIQKKNRKPWGFLRAVSRAGRN